MSTNNVCFHEEIRKILCGYLILLCIIIYISNFKKVVWRTLQTEWIISYFKPWWADDKISCLERSDFSYCSQKVLLDRTFLSSCKESNNNRRINIKCQTLFFFLGGGGGKIRKIQVSSICHLLQNQIRNEWYFISYENELRCLNILSCVEIRNKQQPRQRSVYTSVTPPSPP